MAINLTAVRGVLASHQYAIALSDSRDEELQCLRLRNSLTNENTTASAAVSLKAIA